MKMVVIFLVLCGILLLPAYQKGMAQNKHLDEFSSVPVRQRDRLAQRLHQYVDYERQKQYDKLYEMFSSSFLNQLKSEGVRTGDEYRPHLRKFGYSYREIVDFIPIETVRKAPSVYIISGTLKLNHGSFIDEVTGVIEARWEKGDWYFSEMAMEVD